MHEVIHFTKKGSVIRISWSRFLCKKETPYCPISEKPKHACNKLWNRSTKIFSNKLAIITILLHRSSILPARAWYLLTCFRVDDGTLDRSVFPILSKFSSSCSSNFNLEETPVDSPSIFQGASLLRKQKVITLVSCFNLKMQTSNHVSKHRMFTLLQNALNGEVNRQNHTAYPALRKHILLRPNDNSRQTTKLVIY